MNRPRNPDADRLWWAFVSAAAAFTILAAAKLAGAYHGGMLP